MADPDAASDDEVLAPDHARVAELEARRVDAADLRGAARVRWPELRFGDAGRELSRIGLRVPWALERTDRDIVDELPVGHGLGPGPAETGHHPGVLARRVALLDRGRKGHWVGDDLDFERR